MLVQRNTYTVAPGDSADRIAAKLTGSAARWPELVQANLMTKGTVAGPAGGPRVFSSLQAGEALHVPAWWPDPGSVGAGEPDLGAIVGQILPTVVNPTTGEVGPGVPEIIDSKTGEIIIPVTYTSQTIGNVITAWWPAYTQSKPGATPAPTTPAGKAEIATTLIPSAIAFLTGAAGQILRNPQAQPGEPPVDPAAIPQILSGIPWVKIPWASFPWASVPGIVNEAGFAVGDFWNLLYGATVGTPSTLPYPFGARGMVGQSQTPGVVESPTSLPGGMNPMVWAQLPWGMLLNPPEGFIALLKDPQFQTCLSGDPSGVSARVRTILSTCPTCYVGKGAEKLKMAVCGQDATICDPATCSAAPLPLPVPGPTPNPQPGPGPLPPTKTEKKDNTLVYVLGGAALLLGGYLVMKK